MLKVLDRNLYAYTIKSLLFDGLKMQELKRNIDETINNEHCGSRET